jgi:hypothetical protein
MTDGPGCRLSSQVHLLDRVGIAVKDGIYEVGVSTILRLHALALAVLISGKALLAATEAQTLAVPAKG